MLARLKAKESEGKNAATSKVNAILAAAPIEHRVALQRNRETIRTMVPEAVEAISYGLPAFKYKGKPLAGYGSFKDHCTYFPMSGDTTTKLKKELKAYKTSKGGIHFHSENPLPASLVKKLVMARMNEIEK